MSRILNVETGNGDAPGFTLDVYESHPAAYRAEVRSPEDDTLMVVAGAKLDGAGGIIEAVSNFFLGTPNAHIGKALVEGARLELKLGAHEPRSPEVSGMVVAGAVLEVLSPLLDAHPDIGVDALGDIAARAGVELHRRFRIEERT